MKVKLSEGLREARRLVAESIERDGVICITRCPWQSALATVFTDDDEFEYALAFVGDDLKLLDRAIEEAERREGK